MLVELLESILLVLSYVENIRQFVLHLIDSVLELDVVAFNLREHSCYHGIRGLLKLDEVCKHLRVFVIGTFHPLHLRQPTLIANIDEFFVIFCLRIRSSEELEVLFPLGFLTHTESLEFSTDQIEVRTELVADIVPVCWHMLTLFRHVIILLAVPR